MKLFCFLLFLTPITAFSQTDTLLSYSKIVVIDSTTKEQLFIKGRQWLNEAFVSSKAVIQIADKESGELSGKGYTDVAGTFKMMGDRTALYSCKFSLNIWVKDGKYKYLINDIAVQLQGPGSDYTLVSTSPHCPIKFPMVRESKSDAFWLTIKESINRKMDALTISLENRMKAINPATDF